MPRQEYIKIYALVATASVLLCVHGAEARQQHNKMKITQMYGMSGLCQHLSMGKFDLSDKCTNILINRDLNDGQATEFLFTLKDGNMVFFHGSGGQAHSDPDTAIQTLTGVGFIEGGL